MKTELKDVSSVHKEILIEIEAAEIKPVYDQVVGRYAKMASVPGFRKGFAPRDVVKMRFRDDINNDTVRDLLPKRVTEAIQEYDLQPLSEPQLHLDNQDDAKFNGTENVSVHVHVEVMPVFDEPNYKGLEVVRRVRPVDETEVDRLIESRRQEQASLIPVEDRAAEIGDTVIIDIDGEFVGETDAEDDEPIHVEDLEIELGGEGVQQDFTDNLIGVNVDESKTFTIEYPAEFSSEGLAGKTLRYTALVKSIGKVELPEANDEWAQSLSEGEADYTSLADVRGKLRQDLESMAKMEADNRLRDELMSKLTEANPVEVPPSLVNYQAQGLTQQFAQNMERQGMDMRQADEKLWQMLFQRMLPQAESEVRGALLLDKIGKIENIEVTDQEADEEVEILARYSGRPAADVREMIKQEEHGEANLKERLKNRKAVEILVQNAQITEGEWQEPQPDDAEEENDFTAADESDREANGETPDAETENVTA